VYPKAVWFAQPKNFELEFLSQTQLKQKKEKNNNQNKGLDLCKVMNHSRIDY